MGPKLGGGGEIYFFFLPPQTGPQCFFFPPSLKTQGAPVFCSIFFFKSFAKGFEMGEVPPGYLRGKLKLSRGPPPASFYKFFFFFFLEPIFRAKRLSFGLFSQKGFLRKTKGGFQRKAKKTQKKLANLSLFGGH